MAITTAQIDASEFTNPDHHSNLDKNTRNMHHPIGFRSADVGTYLFKDETGNYTYEQSGILPAALDYVDVTSAAPDETTGNIYLLDDGSATLVVSAINWQSANTVRYTFSGSPDLSSYSTSNNILYVYSAVNTEHNGRFVITAINDGSDYIEVTNTLITDATLDETTGASCEVPHSAWDGASNGDWVRFDGTNWYRVNVNEGTKCYDKTLLQTRTFNGTKWLGDYRVVAIACSDETTALTTGTAKATFRNVGKFYLTNVRASLTTSGTTSGTTTIDINDSATTILSTKLTIDATELTSTTAATAHVISDSILADDASITIDIDAISTGATETGLKVYLIGYFI